MSWLKLFNLGVDPNTPESGSVVLYSKTSDKKIRMKDDTGLVRTLVASGESPGFSLGSSPPGSPTDGMFWIYNGTAGVFWNFVYDSTETTLKWKFVGGAPIVVTISTDETYAADGTYRDATTAGPLFVVPRQGDYSYEAGADQYNSNGGSANTLGIVIGAAGLPSAPHIATQATGGVGTASSNHRTAAFTGLSAGNTIRMVYQASNTGGNANTRWRVLKVLPIRVI